MPQSRENKPAAAQPNIQDVFLNYVRREKLTVTIRMMDGTELEGRIKNFDRFALIFDHNVPRLAQRAAVDHDVAGDEERNARRSPPPVQRDEFRRRAIAVRGKRFAHRGFGQAIAQHAAIGQPQRLG